MLPNSLTPLGSIAPGDSSSAEQQLPAPPTPTPPAPTPPAPTPTYPDPTCPDPACPDPACPDPACPTPPAPVPVTPAAQVPMSPMPVRSEHSYRISYGFGLYPGYCWCHRSVQNGKRVQAMEYGQTITLPAQNGQPEVRMVLAKKAVGGDRAWRNNNPGTFRSEQMTSSMKGRLASTLQLVAPLRCLRVLKLGGPQLSETYLTTPLGTSP